MVHDERVWKSDAARHHEARQNMNQAQNNEEHQRYFFNVFRGFSCHGFFRKCLLYYSTVPGLHNSPSTFILWLFFTIFMITPEQVKHIAKLARLGLQDNDVDKFAKQLSSIMEYVEKLNEVDVKNVEPTSQVTGLENVMREDVVSRFSNREDLLKCTELPVQNDQIQVKSVISM